MYTPINCWKLCDAGKRLYESIEKMEKNYKVKQVGLTRCQFDILLKGMTEVNRQIYSNEIPVGKLMVIKL